MQGRKEGGKEGTMHPAPHHLGTLKIPNNVASTFFKYISRAPKDIRFEHGRDKLIYCPGR